MNKWCEVSNANANANANANLERCCLWPLLCCFDEMVLKYCGWHCLCASSLVVATFPVSTIAYVTESNLWNAHQTARITVWPIFTCSKATMWMQAVRWARWTRIIWSVWVAAQIGTHCSRENTQIDLYFVEEKFKKKLLIKILTEFQHAEKNTKLGIWIGWKFTWAKFSFF